MPRRPSASPQTIPASIYSTVDDSPISHPGAKAEKLTGASQPDESDAKKRKQSRKEKKLRKYPSFMSVTLSDVDGESIKVPDEFPFPGMQTSNENLPGPIQNLNRRVSSPSLGQLYVNDYPYGANPTHAPSPEAGRVGPSTFLRPHYDPAKSPLSISQQTSASSARDMALRKGFPPISNTSSHNLVGTLKPAELEKPYSPTISIDSKVSGDSKLSGTSIKRINSTPGRRPSVMDPPTLYPNMNRSFHANFHPQALIASSLPKPLSSHGRDTSSFSMPRWWEKKKPQVTPPIVAEAKPARKSQEDDHRSIKINVKKPKVGVRDWFVGLEEEGLTFGEFLNPEVSKYQLSENPKPHFGIHEIMAQKTGSLPLTQRNGSLSSNKGLQTHSDGRLSVRLDSPSVRRLYSSSSSQQPGDKCTSENLSAIPKAKSLHSTASSQIAHARLDLKNESFLELTSSSEDEGESSATTSEGSRRQHRIRASIERASYDNEVLVGNAQCAHPVRPRSIVNGRSWHFTKATDSQEIVPPIPRNPDRPRLSQRTSSIQWREITEEKTANTESTIDIGGSFHNFSNTSRSGFSSRSKKKQIIHGSKLMKVTSEEEKLLEAMRDKRASIRQDEFAKGFKTAMHLQDIVRRPKTSVIDGRDSRSLTYGSNSSVFSAPQEYGGKRTLTGSRMSASSDDLGLEDAYPFPKVPPSLMSTYGFVSPPKPSPCLSFSPSDILPETPTSRNSPMTPPSGHGPLGPYGRRSLLSFSGGSMDMETVGHDRKRTASSSVLLDRTAQQAQELDDESAVSKWAMNSW